VAVTARADHPPAAAPDRVERLLDGPAFRRARSLRRTLRVLWWVVSLQAGRRIPAAVQERAARKGVRAAVAETAASRARLGEDARTELATFLASATRLTANDCEAPDVSAIIVTWNQAHLTLRCLEALLAQAGPSIEVVVVDNASTDQTADLLSRIDGAVVLRNATNEGFLLASNRGASVARGRNLLFLNNDAFAQPGAVANALSALESASDIGAVGGRLILPSGRLQEAGCVLWADGVSTGIAAGLPPDAPEAMTRRDAHYCSGAFLMTPTAVWRELGGFDEVFAPGYYEEADYCMRLRRSGRRVVFEPAVEVVHFHLGSEAKAGDALRASERNRQTFCARHADVLRADHPPASARPPAQDPLAFRFSSSRRRA